jgi:hydrogenase large subunit
MWINGNYTNGISVLDRLAARALEAKKIADAMVGWLNELTPESPSYTYESIPVSASGLGLTEAPRGALGHWIDIANSKISRYQVVTPTAWNASPRDDLDQPGPIEQALIGTTIADPSKPIEVLRIVHSFDPCLACSVHMVQPKSRSELSNSDIRPSVG